MAARLPPGQLETKAFPVLQSGPVLHVPVDTYTLEIYGEVEKPVRLTFAELQQWPHVDVTVDIHCVTTWSKCDTKWRGVLFSDVVRLVKPTPHARYVVMECEEGHSTSLPFEELLKPNVMIADAYDGKPIDDKHGGPVRMVVPHKYFYKSAKWLRKLKLVTRDEPGFWEVRGYSNTADPWQEERYS